MEFDWDPEKADSNLAKYGVDFGAAVQVFDDPKALTRCRSADLWRATLSGDWLVKGSVLLNRLYHARRRCAHPAPGGQAVVSGEFIRYRPGIDPKPEDRTDRDRLDQMTDEEVEAAALSDPDAQPMTDEELASMFRPGRLRDLRNRLGLSQIAFAERFQINLRTLQDWEQGRRVPDQVARAYLRIIERAPDAVTAALQD
jgi:putative transcriptional regulator